MDRHSPGGLDFLATPPPGVAQPVVAQGRVVHFDWPSTGADDPVTSTTPPQFSGISLLGADARGAFAFVARPPKRRGKRVRRPSEAPPPPPRTAEQIARPNCRSVTPDAPRRSGLLGDEARSRPASASSAGSVGSVHEGLLKTLWPDA